MNLMDIIGKSKEDVSLPKCELHSLNCHIDVGFWGFMEDEKNVVGERVYYTYIRITHYQSFNVILLICKLSTSSTDISSTNLYLSHATGPHHLPRHLA
jgi:hypothetical protein